MKKRTLQIWQNEQLLFETTVWLANTFFTRFRGLMMTSYNDALPLFLSPSNQIHTYFMRYPIDVYYLDKNGFVISADFSISPWKIGKKRKGGRHILEIPTGKIPPLQENVRMKIL